MNWQKISPLTVVKLMGLWPPYLGAGIALEEVSDDMRYIKVRMRLSWKNINYVGSHFGGNLFSMTDPWYMFMFIHNLGPDYRALDKAGSIQFRRPGKGKVTAEFRIDQAMIDSVKADIAANGKTERTLGVNIIDESGEVVAEVQRTVWMASRQRPSRA